MDRPFITPAEQDELQELYARLPGAIAFAAIALRTEGQPMTPAQVSDFLDRDRVVDGIRDRIYEILNDAEDD